MKYIRVTRSLDNKTVYVNIDKICMVYPELDGEKSTIDCGFTEVYVKVNEGVEDIINMINSVDYETSGLHRESSVRMYIGR